MRVREKKNIYIYITYSVIEISNEKRRTSIVSGVKIDSRIKKGEILDMLQGQVESSRESRFFILYILIDVILSHISLYPRRGKVAENVAWLYTVSLRCIERTTWYMFQYIRRILSIHTRLFDFLGNGNIHTHISKIWPRKFTLTLLITIFINSNIHFFLALCFSLTDCETREALFSRIEF